MFSLTVFVQAFACYILKVQKNQYRSVTIMQASFDHYYHYLAYEIQRIECFTLVKIKRDWVFKIGKMDKASERAVI